MDRIPVRVSIVSPVYNESSIIEEFYSRIKKIESLFLYPFEVILVNDGSTDSSFSLMRRLAASDKDLKIIDLARNFGHQIAVRAGISYSSGDVTVIMDSDLQDPPELVEKFVAKWKEGYQVVYAIRRNRKEGFLLRFLYAAFYRLLKLVSDTQIPLDSGDFCLLDKEIVKILVSLPEKNPFLRGLRSWVGYKQAGIEYDRQERFKGKSKHNLPRLFKLAFDGIFSFSVLPLRVSAILGFIISVCAFLNILVLLFYRMPMKGMTAIVILILFLGGVQLISIGILGEYIGRVYDEVKLRPLYLIKEKINL